MINGNRLKNQPVKVEKVIKKFMVILMFVSVLLMSACSGADKINYFSSKEETFEHFIQNEDVKGTIDLITTINDESLLVVQSTGNTYFVGELVEDKKGYYANRISASVTMTGGGSWEIKTEDRNEYTIFFEKDKEDANSIQFSRGDYTISLVEGHTITQDILALNNVIKEVETVKD